MSRPQTSKLFENLVRLSISDFRGYLSDTRACTGHLQSLMPFSPLIIDTGSERPFAMFSYWKDGRKIPNFVPLVKIAGNLGKGYVWYFVCPETGKRCRTLYSANGCFYHRTAFSNTIYRSQAASKKSRRFTALGIADRAVEEFFSGNNVRTHYKGKPTKRYTRLLRQIERSARYEREITHANNSFSNRTF